jgi:hypothetical protein
MFKGSVGKLQHLLIHIHRQPMIPVPRGTNYSELYQVAEVGCLEKNRDKTT